MDLFYTEIKSSADKKKRYLLWKYYFAVLKDELSRLASVLSEIKKMQNFNPKNSYGNFIQEAFMEMTEMDVRYFGSLLDKLIFGGFYIV